MDFFITLMKLFWLMHLREDIFTSVSESSLTNKSAVISYSLRTICCILVLPNLLLKTDLHPKIPLLNDRIILQS